MAQIKALTLDSATGPARDLLETVKKKMGGVPNILATMANSPSALEAYLGFSGALAKGQFSAKLREQIALTVAGQNSCDYCASVHTALAKGAGASEEDARLAIAGKASDERTAIVLGLAKNIVETRGFVAPEVMENVRAAGFSDAEIIEIIANVSLNIFTNYFNHIAGTEIDFPVVNTKEVLSAA